MLCLALCVVFSLFNLQSLSTTYTNQAYTPQFLEMSDIQNVINTLTLFVAFCAVWFAFILATIFGSCYVLGFAHGKEKLHQK